MSHDCDGFRARWRTVAYAHDTPDDAWHSRGRGFDSRYVDGDVVPIARDPEQFLIAVTGGESGHHALYFSTFGFTWSIAKPCLARRGL